MFTDSALLGRGSLWNHRVVADLWRSYYRCRTSVVYTPRSFSFYLRKTKIILYGWFIVLTTKRGPRIQSSPSPRLPQWTLPPFARLRWVHLSGLERDWLQASSHDKSILQTGDWTSLGWSDDLWDKGAPLWLQLGSFKWASAGEICSAVTRYWNNAAAHRPAVLVVLFAPSVGIWGECWLPVIELERVMQATHAVCSR